MSAVLRALLFGLFAMVSLVSAPVASGAVNLTSVNVDNHQISAEWTSDPMDTVIYLEASQSNAFPDSFDTYSQFIFPDDGAAPIEDPVPGGHYFVRVTYRACDTCPLQASNVRELDVRSDAATFTSVSYSGGVLSAQWSLVPGTEPIALNVSASTARGTFGFLSGPEFPLEPGATTFAAPPEVVTPGVYYVEVVTTPRPDLCAGPIVGRCAFEFSNIGSFSTIPGSSSTGPGGPGAAGSATDKVVSLGAITARSSQDVDKLSITLDPGEGVKAKLSGSVTVPGASKVYRFKTVNKSVAAGKKTKLSLKLGSKAKRAVKRALRRKKLKAKLTLVVTDNAGNARTKKYTVRLRR